MSSGPQKGSRMYAQLANHGPQTNAELGGSPNTNLRQDGVWSFRPNHARNSHPSGTVGGGTMAVYYIKCKHSPETVIRKWLDVNDIEDQPIPNRTIHRRIAKHDEAFREPSQEILGPFEPRGNHENHGEAVKEGQKGECPLCGEDYTRGLARHLPCDNE